MMATRSATERGLAAAALGLGTLALIAGDPSQPAVSSSISPPSELSWVDGYSESRVDPVTLAEWIRDRRPDLSIVDVRSASDYADFHIPRAIHAPLAQLGALPVGARSTVVVYGAALPDAQRAWVILRAFGHPNVRALERGIHGWLVDIVNPVLPRPTSPAEEIEFDRRAELSRYFGGLPRLGEPGRGAEGTDDVLNRTRRRGCAF